jgi:proteic killer suppression protein
MGYRVRLEKALRRRLRRVPRYVIDKLEAWIELVETDGLEEARRIPGFHDEPLIGQRAGQRSIRLSRQWRAIYEVQPGSDVVLVVVKEVMPHDY